MIDKDSQHNYWPAHVYTQVHIPGHTGAHTRAPTHNLELHCGIFAPVPNMLLAYVIPLLWSPAANTCCCLPPCRSAAVELGHRHRGQSPGLSPGFVTCQLDCLAQQVQPPVPPRLCFSMQVLLRKPRQVDSYRYKTGLYSEFQSSLDWGMRCSCLKKRKERKSKKTEPSTN